MSDKERSDRGSVVVTGTSTGIGAACALHLAELGFHVFAGVRRHEDGEALQARSTTGLTPLILEITDEASISAAVETVTADVGDGGLAGLVNNAGIVKPAPLEFQPLSDFREQLEVDLVAQLAVTQAFLPLIRQGGGRIVNIGSIGGRLSLPLHGAYCASKFAMEALTDSLRLELRQWGIHVCLVDPGVTESAIFDKELAELDRLEDVLGRDGYQRYEAQITAIRGMVAKTVEDAAPASDLAEVVGDALTSKKPDTRYYAGHGAKAAVTMAKAMPDHLKDAAIAREAGLPHPS